MGCITGQPFPVHTSNPMAFSFAESGGCDILRE
jgi:hypothetical protein